MATIFRTTCRPIAMDWISRHIAHATQEGRSDAFLETGERDGGHLYHIFALTPSCLLEYFTVTFK